MRRQHFRVIDDSRDGSRDGAKIVARDEIADPFEIA